MLLSSSLQNATDPLELVLIKVGDGYLKDALLDRVTGSDLVCAVRRHEN
jgi:hypothetical protein